MPIYADQITALAAGTAQKDLIIKGDFISQVGIKFPPGPNGLVGVSVWYGPKQIFPYAEGTMFRSEDWTVQWDEKWDLPESPCTLTVKIKNDDTLWPHTIYYHLVTVTKDQSLAGQIVGGLIQALKSAGGIIGV